MKKVATALLSTATYLTLTPIAFAQTTVNLCSANSGSINFKLLCALNINNLPSVINSIITILFGIAILIALIYLIYGGYKWITSGGDKQAVTSARDHIIAAIVGLLLVLLSYLIINFLLGFLGIGSIGNLVFPTI